VLPFPERSFDLVLCQDVLEHVPPADRPALLAELRRVARRWLLLAAPFAAPGVRDADALLYGLVKARHGYEHVFLREHLTHGHPDLAATVAAFEAAGATTVVLPNGHLPYWTLMQAANLLLAEPALGARYARAQARYNGRVADWREPAYRHLVVVDLAGRTDWCAAVRTLVHDDGDAEAAARRERDAAALSEILTLAATAESVAAAPPPEQPGRPVASAPLERSGESAASASPSVASEPAEPDDSGPLARARGAWTRLWRFARQLAADGGS
jgi:hypothetical protein